MPMIVSYDSKTGAPLGFYLNKNTAPQPYVEVDQATYLRIASLPISAWKIVNGAIEMTSDKVREKKQERASERARAIAELHATDDDVLAALESGVAVDPELVRQRAQLRQKIQALDTGD